MSLARYKRFAVNYGASLGKQFCRCQHQYYGHRSRGGSCYACECPAFQRGVNPSHRWAVAPRKTTIYGDHKYDSIAEAEYARTLDWRKSAGDIADWTPHPLLRLEFNGFHVIDYRIDFEVFFKDGNRQYVEVKGPPARTPIWRLKWKLLQAMYKNDPAVGMLLVDV